MCVSSSPAMSSTRDDDAKNKRLFDLRTLERNIKKGLITRKDYEKYLKSLPDVATQVAPAVDVHMSDDAGDDDDLDDDDDDDEGPGAKGDAHSNNSVPS